MSIATAIQNAQNKVAAAYTAAGNKGATLPQTQDLSNLATCIGSIETGGGSDNIIRSYELNNGTLSGIYPTTFTTQATDITNNALTGAFYRCTNLTAVSFPKLNYISGEYALERTFMYTTIPTAYLTMLISITGRFALNQTYAYNTSLTAAYATILTTVSGDSALFQTFQGCTSLATADFSYVKTVSGVNAFYGCFYNCSSLTTMNFSKLETISGTNAFYQAFYGCSNLTTVNFPKLSDISAYSALSSTFSRCTKLTHIYFNALTTTSFGSNKNQFSNMLSSTGTTYTHKIHFPSNLQSTISGLTGYPNFGGTSGYVTLSFDLPATS